MIGTFLRNVSYKFCKQLSKIQNEAIVSTQNTQTERLSKWISQQSICSRREAQQIIQLGLVRINGDRVFKNQLIPINSKIKAYTPMGIQTARPITKLWMINKPRGCICSHRDPQNRTTIYSLLPPQLKNSGHIISVGRLDFNSQGLLLLTNDPTLKSLLEHPDANYERYYRVKVHGRVTEQKLEKMSQPIIIKGQQYGPLRVQFDRELSTNVWLDVSMKTGKNREIRRIMQKCDLQVNKLIRLAYGPYKLRNLGLRQIVELTVSEGLDRKLKKTKAQKLSKKSNTLIQIDVRSQAIQYAKLQALKRKDSINELKQQSGARNIQDNNESRIEDQNFDEEQNSEDED